MRTAITAVWATIVCAFFIQTANSLQTDLIGLMADGVFSSSVIGALMAIYYAGYIFAPFFGRVLIARIGHAGTVVFAMVLPAAVILLQPLIITGPAWALFRLLSGFAMSLSYVAVESWIHGRVENAQRGRVFSLYMFAQLLGMTVAQGLFGLGSVNDYGMFAAAAALFLCAAVPVVLSRRSAPSGIPPMPLALPTLFRLAPMGACATVLAGLSWAILFTFGPVYAKRVGFNISGIGLFMALAVAAGGLVQMPAGWMSDHLGRRPVLFILFGGGVVASLLAIIAQGATASLIAVALSGGFIFPIYAVSAAAVNDHVAQEARVAAAGGLVLLFGIGSVFGPLLCGALMGAIGPYGFFVLLAATMATGFVTTLLFAHRRAV